MRKQIFVLAAFIALSGCGKTDVISKQVHSADSDSPEIKVNKSYKLYTGESFNIDNQCESKDLTLSYTGIVNTDSEGKYPITVTATDKEGNIAIKNITVTVSPAPVVKTAEPTATPTATPESTPQSEAPQDQPVQNEQTVKQPAQSQITVTNPVITERNQPQDTQPQAQTPANNSAASSSGGNTTGSDAPPSANGTTENTQPNLNVMDAGSCYALVNQQGGSCYAMEDGSGYYYSN